MFASLLMFRAFDVLFVNSCSTCSSCEEFKENDPDGCGISTLDPLRLWAVPRSARLEVVVGPALV